MLAIANTGVAPLLLTIRSQRAGARRASSRSGRTATSTASTSSPSPSTEVEQLVDDLLGAPSHALAYEWIYRLSEGNPLYVTELVADARRTGRVELRDGRWHLADGQRAVRAARRPPRLPHRVGVGRGRGGAGGAGARRADAPRGLRGAGAGRAPSRSSSGPGWRWCPRTQRGLLVELAHPLYGEVVRGATCRRPPPGASGATSPAPSPASGPTRPAERLAVARLLLESGQVDEERFLEASSIALRLGAPDLAGDLAAAVAAVAARRAAAWPRLARAPPASARWTRCWRRSRTRRRPPTPRSPPSYVETRVRCLLRGPGDQRDQVRPFIARFETWHDDADWRALRRRSRPGWRCTTARTRGRAPCSRPALADPAVGAERRLLLLLASARATARRGRVDDYDAIMVEIERAHRGARRSAVRHRAERHARGRRPHRGRPATSPRVRQRAVRRLEQANLRGDPFEYLRLLYLLAQLEHVQGHHAEARAPLPADHRPPRQCRRVQPRADHRGDAVDHALLPRRGEAGRRALGRTEAAIERMPSLATGDRSRRRSGAGHARDGRRTRVGGPRAAAGRRGHRRRRRARRVGVAPRRPPARGRRRALRRGARGAGRRCPGRRDPPLGAPRPGRRRQGSRRPARRRRGVRGARPRSRRRPGRAWRRRRSGTPG